eukprot:GHVU01068863.1.p1 GENE.GHVU01068863.1~~GHVU01068863.1.p1  ORF type:complete len:347 (+),score=44.89 GHVU01068863.1:1963-3003(+)
MSRMRWATIQGVSTYITGVSEDVQLLQYNRLCKLPEPYPGLWWVVNSFVGVVLTIWKHHMKRMQADTLTFEQQHLRAKELEAALLALFPDGIVQEVRAEPRPEEPLRTTGAGSVKLTTIGPFRIRHATALQPLTRCSATALAAFPADRDRVPVPPALLGTDQDAVLTAAVRFFLVLLHGVRVATLDRPDRQQRGSAGAPPSSPFGFTRWETDDVGTLARKHMHKLRSVFPEDTEIVVVQKVIDEHRELCRRVSTMEEGAGEGMQWELLRGFPYLKRVAAITRTVIPHTCQVEGDFSRAAALSDNRGGMGVQGVQGLMHARQLPQLREIVALLRSRRRQASGHQPRP